MQITDSEIIKAGEKELIDTIVRDLDWNAIEKIFKEKRDFRIQDGVECRQGNIVVYDNQVAYQLDFDVTVTLSVLLDRAGNHLSFNASVSDGEPSAAISSDSNDDAPSADLSSQVQSNDPPAEESPTEVTDDLDISGLVDHLETSHVQADASPAEESPTSVTDDLDISGLVNYLKASP